MFFSYFKELVGKEVTVELKNDLAITGTLHSVDQYLNIKLENTRVVDEAKYPHMVIIPNAPFPIRLSLQTLRSQSETCDVSRLRPFFVHPFKLMS